MRLTRHLAGAGALAVIGATLSVATAPPALADGGDVTFTPSGNGSDNQFLVPAGVTSVTVVAIGAGGGGYHGGSEESQYPGGAGAQVTDTVAVTPGETLAVSVGSGGYGGQYDLGAGGGGRSVVRNISTIPSAPLVIAGGGGGAGSTGSGGHAGFSSSGLGGKGMPLGAGGVGGGSGLGGAGGSSSQASLDGKAGTSTDGGDGAQGGGGHGGRDDEGGQRGTSAGGGGGGAGYGGGGGGAGNVNDAFGGGGGGGGSLATSNAEIVTDHNTAGMPDSAGFDGSVRITWTAQQPTAPAIDSVSIEGEATVGTTLTAKPGSVSGSPNPVLAYQWQSRHAPEGAWSDVPSETSATYQVREVDHERWLRVRVTASNGIDPEATKMSDATSQIHGVAPAIASVSLSGTATVGETLTADAQDVSGFPTPTVSYTWQRAATPNDEYTAIDGADQATYQLGADDYGQYLRAVAVAVNGEGPEAVKASTTTEVVSGTEPGITAVSIDGSLTVSSTLTATPVGLTGVPEAEVSYQWQRSQSADGEFSDIENASERGYDITTADVASYLRVVATASNAEGTSSPATSAAVGPVGPALPGAPMVTYGLGGPETAEVYWAAPTEDGGSPITTYTVTAYLDHKAVGGCELTDLSNQPFQHLHCNAVGLDAGFYTFTVTASSEAGASAESDPYGPVQVHPASGRVPLSVMPGKTLPDRVREHVVFPALTARQVEQHATLTSTTPRTCQVRDSRIFTAAPGLCEVVVVSNVCSRTGRDRLGSEQACRTRRGMPLNATLTTTVVANKSRAGEPAGQVRLAKVAVVSFERDGADLNRDAKRTLRKLGEETTHAQYLVVGHAHRTGTGTHHHSISELRATAVAGFLERTDGDNAAVLSTGVGDIHSGGTAQGERRAVVYRIR